MLTDERLAMTTTKRERAQENTTDAFHIRNGLVKEAVIVKTEADCEKIVPSKTKRQPKKKKDKRCSPKYL